MKKVPSMPASLDEALTCLEEDHSFLTKGDVFSEELIETFVTYKRRAEAEAVAYVLTRTNLPSITISELFETCT